MNLPSMQAIGQAVILTVVSLVIINLAKPYLPAALVDKLKA